MLGDYAKSLDSIQSNLDMFSNRDLSNLDSENFGVLYSQYRTLWQNVIFKNYLNGINPNDLGIESLGNLIVKSVFEAFLLSEKDIRLCCPYMITLWSSSQKMDFNHIVGKISYLVNLNTVESRHELNNIFNEVKNAFNIMILSDYIDYLGNSKGKCNNEYLISQSNPS